MQIYRATGRKQKQQYFRTSWYITGKYLVRLGGDLKTLVGRQKQLTKTRREKASQILNPTNLDMDSGNHVSSSCRYIKMKVITINYFTDILLEAAKQHIIFNQQKRSRAPRPLWGRRRTVIRRARWTLQFWTTPAPQFRRNIRPDHENVGWSDSELTVGKQTESDYICFGSSIMDMVACARLVWLACTVCSPFLHEPST